MKFVANMASTLRPLYKWRTALGGMPMARLPEFEGENCASKKMYVGVCLKAEIIQETMEKK